MAAMQLVHYTVQAVGQGKSVITLPVMNIQGEVLKILDLALCFVKPKNCSK